MTKSEVGLARQCFRHSDLVLLSTFVIRHSSFLSAFFWNSAFGLRILHADEFLSTYCLRLCRCPARGGPVLFAQTKAGREAGAEHFAVAKVPGRNASQRAVPTIAQELAADPAAHIVDDGRAGA